MAKKASLNLLEQHVEKGLLGLAGVFLLSMIVYHLVLEPNRIEFGGQKLGPRELDEAILRQAETLQRAIQTAQPVKADLPAYSRHLEQSFKAGIFGEDPNGGPPIPVALRVPAVFGPPLPDLEEGVSVQDIVVVKPLKPSPPVVQTGVSLAWKVPPPVPGRAPEPTAAPTPGQSPEGPVELTWVTVAAYFPLEAQQQAMEAAKYEKFRAKPYFVGVDVQRQEMTASGEYSDWEDVPTSQAMPKLDLPKPVFEEGSGRLVNQAVLEEKLEAVKQAQQLLIQAPFYPVEAGDEWTIPPLPGHEPKEEEEESAPTEDKKEKEREREAAAGGKRAAGGGMPPPPPPPSGGRTGGARTGGGMTAPGGMPQAQPTGGQKSTEKQSKENLKNARKALKEKDWSRAEQLARSVLADHDASKADQSAAKKILKDAERLRDQKAARERTTPVSGPGRPPTREPIPLVTRPTPAGTREQTDQQQPDPAIWFHDDSVQPGKTYRYRMRVKLWNRYVGRRDVLRDPTQAEQAVLLGEWSDPSPPITAAPKRHFFVRGPSFGEPAASVEVFTWHKGNWFKEDFKVRVGDTIGGPVEVKTGELDKDDKPKREKLDFSTDAVVLDLRFEEPTLIRKTAGKAGEFTYREGRSLVLVYLDPADGQVKEKVAELDKSDPVYKKLKEEWESFKETL